MNFASRCLLLALLSILPVGGQASAATVTITATGTITSARDPQEYFGRYPDNQLQPGNAFLVTGSFDMTKGLRTTLPSLDYIRPYPFTENPFLGGLLGVGSRVIALTERDGGSMSAVSDGALNLFRFGMGYISAELRTQPPFFTASLETPFVYQPRPDDRYLMSLFIEGEYDQDGNVIVGESPPRSPSRASSSRFRKRRCLRRRRSSRPGSR